MIVGLYDGNGTRLTLAGDQDGQDFFPLCRYDQEG
jgi:hypothetical protein